MTTLLVDRAPDGRSHVITRGSTDPQNRERPDKTSPIKPGKFYDVEVPIVPDDYVLRAGHRLEFVVISSDYDYTLRPRRVPACRWTSPGRRWSCRSSAAGVPCSRRSDVVPRFGP